MYVCVCVLARVRARVRLRTCLCVWACVCASAKIDVFKILNGHENIDPNIFFKMTCKINN